MRLELGIRSLELLLILCLIELNDIRVGKLDWDRGDVVVVEIWWVLCLEFREGLLDDDWFLVFGLYKIFVGDGGFMMLEVCVGFWWLGSWVILVWGFWVVFWFLVFIFIGRWEKFWGVFLILFLIFLIDFDFLMGNFLEVFVCGFCLGCFEEVECKL